MQAKVQQEHPAPSSTPTKLAAASAATPATAFVGLKRKAPDQVASERLLGETTLEQNWRALDEQGLPPFDVRREDGGVRRSDGLPVWLKDADLELHARVIDYLTPQGSQQSRALATYLRHLGFSVPRPGFGEAGSKQAGSSCGIVAAHVTTRLHAAMEISPTAWRTTSVADAVRKERIVDANERQDDWANSELTGADCDDRIEATTLARNPATTRFLSNDEVMRLVLTLRGDGRTRDIPWLSVTSLDSTLRQIVQRLEDVATGRTAAVPLNICVTNTQLSNQSGYHWFTVAYSIRRCGSGQAALAVAEHELDPVDDAVTIICEEDEEMDRYYGEFDMDGEL